jgi:SAM-dependent methyltransferase
MPVKIEVELSAVASRPRPRSISSRLAPLLAEEADRVADVGCGYLAGTKELLRHHQRVYAIDTALQEKRIASRLAAIQTNTNFAGFRMSGSFASSKLRLGGAYVVNVLHTLPTPKAREALLQSIQRNLRTGGFVVIDVARPW